MSKVSTDFSAVTTVGLDIAKLVFQVHAVDAAGSLIISRAIKRRDLLAFFAALPPCLVGIEACGTSHHWGRELEKLGHRVRALRGHDTNCRNSRRHPVPVRHAVARHRLPTAEPKPSLPM